MPAHEGLVDSLILLDLFSGVGSGFGGVCSLSCVMTGAGLPLRLEKCK
jgi:hypothetical protein